MEERRGIASALFLYALMLPAMRSTVWPDAAVIALYGANAGQTLQGDLALIAKLLVDGLGRDDIESPLVQHHGICL